MPRYSETFTLPDGTRGIVCFSGRRKTKPCSVCGGSSTLLCDFPNGTRTCDAPLCRRCAISLRGGRDYCPNHILPDAA